MKLLIENWRSYISENEAVKCPPPTQDLDLNTKNRDRCRKEADYGPMNPLKPSLKYWQLAAGKWAGATPQEAMGQRCGNCVAFDVSPRMLECLPISTDQVDPMSMVDEQLKDKMINDFPGFPKEGAALGFGYCHMWKFKCHSARACNTWAGGGPVETDEQSIETQTGKKQDTEDDKNNEQ